MTCLVLGARLYERDVCEKLRKAAGNRFKIFCIGFIPRDGINSGAIIVSQIEEVVPTRAVGPKRKKTG